MVVPTLPLTHAFPGVTVVEQPVHPSEGVVCLSMQQVYRGTQDLHLGTHGRDPVPVPGEEYAYGTELLSAVFDVPDLVVKVPEGEGEEGREGGEGRERGERGGRRGEGEGEGEERKDQCLQVSIGV